MNNLLAGPICSIRHRAGVVLALALRYLPLLHLGIGLSVMASSALAETVSIVGVITQSTQDGTGPAVNNPALNSIRDGDSYTLVLTFSGSIATPGTYALDGGTLAFVDSAAPASETAFASFVCAGHNSLACLTVTPDGISDDITILACLTTGSGCLTSNQLDLNFRIPAASLNSQNVAAEAVNGLTPLDLLEDDGATDIQGTVAQYSYTGVSSVPEPSSIFLFLPVVVWLLRPTQRSR